jgi:PEGA domain
MNNFTRQLFTLSIALIGLAAMALAKEPPPQVMLWPAFGSPVVRFSFSKFKEVGSLGKQHNYIIDTTAENLWSKKISSVVFSLYLYDKDKARIGEGWLSVSDLGPGQTAKFQTTVGASGTPVSLEIAPRSLPSELQPLSPPKTISLTVNSVPQGATVKVDGTDAGVTPKIARLGVGKHTLEFRMEGFNNGTFPLEVGPDDVSGGSVSYELGTSAHDSVELRDGSVLSGDLESISAMEVVVRIGGTPQTFNRNQIKRILLVERNPPKP